MNRRPPRVVEAVCLLTLAVFLHTASQASAVEIIRSAAGADYAAISPTVNQFRSELGADNGSGGPAAEGRREVSWEDVPNSATADLPSDFYGAAGLSITSPGGGVRVSLDGSPGEREFGNVNPTYPGIFAHASGVRLMMPRNATQTDFTFRMPGTTTPAAVAGFGVILTDVDSASSAIEFFDQFGGSLGAFAVPAASGSKSLSFVGVRFSDERRASRVRVTSGNAPAPTTDNPGTDVVAVDDVIFAEPTAQQPPPVVEFTSDNLRLYESSGIATATLTRTGDTSRSAMIEVATIPGTATAEEDYFAPPTTITFSAGEKKRTIGLAVRGDAAVEPDETLSLELRNPSRAVLGAISRTTITILNDDQPPRTAPIPPDTVRPVVIAVPKGRPKLATFARQGQPVRVGCSEACKLSIRIEVDAKTAKRLKLKSRILSETKQVAFIKSESARIMVKAKKRAARALLRRKVPGRIRFILRTRAVDGSGNQTEVLERFLLRRR